MLKRFWFLRVLLIVFMSSIWSIRIPESPSMLLNNFDFAFDMIDTIADIIPELQSFEFIMNEKANATQISVYFQEEHSLVHFPGGNPGLPLGNITVLGVPQDKYNCRVHPSTRKISSC